MDRENNKQILNTDLNTGEFLKILRFFPGTFSYCGAIATPPGFFEGFNANHPFGGFVP